MHPLIAGRVLFPLQERLKGKPTFRLLKGLERSQWFSEEELRRLQFENLKHLLEFAYASVPYYQQLFEPTQIKDLHDFQRIPCLTREALQNKRDSLRSRTVLRGIQKISTGGSTGSPVTVFVDPLRNAFIDAARLRSHRWFDTEVGAREIVLWGSPIELTKQDYARVVRDHLLNSRLLSAFNLTEATLSKYAGILRRYCPERIYGYASVIYTLAVFLEARGWKRSGKWPKVVFTTAEPLYDFQRELIKRVFGCPVSVEYGARDAGLMANECPMGGLHIPAEGMIVEVDSQEIGGVGEIIVTNLYSRAMPIIRYRTGDVGALDQNPCACGRRLPRLKQIEGRQTDFLVSSDGRILHALSVIYILREIPGIREFRVLQESLNEIQVLVVPEQELSHLQRCSIASKIRSLLGNAVNVKIESLAQLPPSPSGKFRYVVSKIAQSYLDRLGRGQSQLVPTSRACR